MTRMAFGFMAALVIAAGMAFLWPVAVAANPGKCAQREAVETRLQAIGEYQIARAIQRNRLFAAQLILEVFVNPSTGAWTILQTYPSGLSCMIQFGTDFGFVKAAKQEPDF